MRLALTLTLVVVLCLAFAIGVAAENKPTQLGLVTHTFYTDGELCWEEICYYKFLEFPDGTLKEISKVQCESYYFPCPW